MSRHGHVYAVASILLIVWHAIALGQHDTGRNAVRLLAAGKLEDASEMIGRGDGRIDDEVMNSRLTNQHTHELMEKAKGSEFIMGYNQKCSFGLLEFDTTQDDPQVTYSIVDIDDEVVGTRVVRLSELSVAEETP